MEIPEGAKKEAQIKYEKKIRDIVGQILPIFQKEELNVNDMNNVINLLQSELGNTMATVKIKDLIELSSKK